MSKLRPKAWKKPHPTRFLDHHSWRACLETKMFCTAAPQPHCHEPKNDLSSLREERKVEARMGFACQDVATVLGPQTVLLTVSQY